MPATRKHALKDQVQGYTTILLNDDLANLAKLRKVDDDGTVTFDEDVKKLIIGRACAAVKDQVDSTLRDLFKKLTKLLPADVVKSDDLKYTMGPLKRVSRITAKAAHYAVCAKENHAKPQLQNVRDILRATMVFPPSAWGDKADKIGAKMIDKINEHFDKKVVQVKNRFIHDHYPNFAQLTGVTLPDDLDKFIESTFKQTLWARDSFYRDLQLLIRLDYPKYDNTEALGHVMLELQLASSKMYSGKTHKNRSGVSGHDMYKNVRAVSEYCEFLWWKRRHKKLELPKAEGYYDQTCMKMEDFVEQSEAMAEMYRDKDLNGMEVVLRDAIDDSDWYKANSGGN